MMHALWLMVPDVVVVCGQASTPLRVGELLRQVVQQSGCSDVDDWFLEEVVCTEELGQLKCQLRA